MNTDDIEDRLREAMLLHAAEAPPGAAMLSTITTESARRGRRARLTSLSAGVAVLVSLGLALPFALRSGGPHGDDHVVAAPPAVAASPSPAPTLVPATVPAAITFPFTPSAAYGAPAVMLAGGHPTAMQRHAGGTATLTLLDARPAAPSSKTFATPSEVGGRPATLYEWHYSDDDPGLPYTDLQRTLVWQPTPTTWLTLRMTPTPPATDLVSYAGAVRPGALSSPSPFAFGLMPAGWTVDNISAAAVTFRPPGVEPGEGYDNKIAVMLDESPATEPPAGDVPAARVKVGQRTGWLTTTPDVQFLRVPTGDGHSLLLQVAPKASLPQDELIRFAAAITVSPAAEVSRG
ncbi:hypothetical protein AB0M46_15795 [Dactylosporangium sp. NPDC051485]|uniref:hypothetical protein n=1 Tax=Dactylosporangium sp. NPDC051485 TaxID=3154846 RepID=UPI003426DCD2